MKTSDKKEKIKYAEDAILSYAVSCALDKTYNEEPEEIHTPSEEHNKKMQEIFKLEKKLMMRKKIIKLSKIAAIFMAGFLAVSAVSILGVEAWRVKFFNILQDTFETHTEIHFSETKEPLTSYVNNNIIIDYIPKGFYLESETKKISEFKNAEDAYFTVSIQKTDIELGVDTENAKVEMIDINNNQGIMIIKNNIIIITWSFDERAFIITSENTDKSELLKIAESIRLNQQ